MFFSGMDDQRTNQNSQFEYIVDLREDPLPFPVQCSDAGDVGHADQFIDLQEETFPVQCSDAGDVGHADQFIDLQEETFPVQCSEPSEVNVPHRIAIGCLDTLLRIYAVRLQQDH